MLMLEDKIAKIINTVAEKIQGCEIGCYDDDCYIRDEWDTILLNLLKKVDPNIRVNYGISKIVIIPSFSNYVIKFPMKGTWYERDNWSWNDETEEWEENDEEYSYDFYDFSYGGGEHNNDYCALELDIYKRILEEAPDCAFIFPETSYYGKVRDTDFYLQKKCIELNDADEEEISEDSKAKGSELSRYTDLDSYWVEVLVEKVGEIFAKKILDTIEDFNITDLHNHNIGFDLITGMPMIIDFCGFDS